jgi:hypothetical protein
MSTTRYFRGDLASVFDACLSAVTTLSMTVDTIDKSNGMLAFKSKQSMSSAAGNEFSLFVQEAGKWQAKVTITGRKATHHKYRLQIDFGSTSRIAAKVMSEIGHVLEQSPSVERLDPLPDVKDLTWKDDLAPKGDDSLRLESSSDSRQERECPFCAEVILLKAKICKHCGRDVPTEQQSVPASSKDDDDFDFWSEDLMQGKEDKPPAPNLPVQQVQEQVRIRCACGARFKSSIKNLGKDANCPKCGNRLKIAHDGG